MSHTANQRFSRTVLRASILGASLMLAPVVSATQLSINQTPLFTQNAAKPNLILAIDDSGSMDAELLFSPIHGYLYWDTSGTSAAPFSVSGVLNDSDKKYIYLFPNGSGTGERVYGDGADHFAVPPLPQFGFARSSDFNPIYYNPNQTYAPWHSGGSDSFGDIDETDAPSEPVSGSSTLDLTADQLSDSSDHMFRVYDGLVLPSGTEIKVSGSSSTLSSDKTVPFSSPENVGDGDSIGISYWPATYYVATTSGGYSFSNGTGTTSGNCSSPDPSHYEDFAANPVLTSIGAGIHALAYDGTCLTRVEIKSSVTSYDHDGSRTDCASSSVCTYDEQIQNFANWFSYYRKRHLALRAGMGQAFEGVNALRAGYFTINNRSDVTMNDLSVAATKSGFYDDLYDLGGNDGGTPNREALKYAGDQFMRTDNSAPITEACQKNFTLFFTDGYSGISGVPTTSDTDEDGNSMLTDNSAGDPYEDAVPSGGSGNLTLGDIAWHYYETNLRDDLASGAVPSFSGCNVTPVDPSLDCNTDPHMNTYTVGLGALGTIYGVTHDSVADAYVSTPSWPDVNLARDATQIDDLYHAAVNGRGEIYNASAGSELGTELISALLAIQSEQGAAAAVTFNTATLESSSSVYLALFNSALWTGDLKAFDLSSVGNVSLSAGWSAAEELDDGTPSANSRVILTFDDSSNTGVAFRWASLTPTQRSDFNASTALTGSNGLTGQDALDYIRGDRTNEGVNKFRVRESILGDIIGGSPVFVGEPNLNWPSAAPFPTAVGEKYTDFQTSQKTSPRTQVVYVGANDGMLHGFDASSGEEVLAYVPNLVYSSSADEGLHYLTEPDYQHHFYVDQSPTVSDVYIETDPLASPAVPEWRTVLVGSLQAGGKGLFALDITDPSSFSESNAADLVLWEFWPGATSNNPLDLQDLGLGFSKPSIAMMENGRWAAIFGNGYNSANEQAKLFIVFLDGGVDGTWTDGSASSDLDYIVIDTDGSSSNGLSTPRVLDVDGNGAADRVYAGDLQGNMWAFDLSDASTLGSPNSVPSWGVAYSNSGTPAPLFVATDSSSNPQPITTKPAVAFHPTDATTNGNSPNLMVFFGTGQFLESADQTSTATQSFYGVWDTGSGELGRGDLQEQTLTDVTENGTTFRTVTDDSVNGSEDGWFMDLPASGERSVVNPATRGKAVFFNTWIPSSDACSAGGSGFLMSVAQENGGEYDTPLFDTDDDGDVDSDDALSSGDNAAGQEFLNGLPASSRFLSTKQYTPGTSSDTLQEDGGGIREVEDLGGVKTGRLSWQELRDN